MRSFEFGDLSWVPDWYHVNMRRYLIFYYKVFGYFKLWIPALSEFISHTGAKKFLELGSGGGEALGLVVSALPDEIIKGREFILSDLSPSSHFVEKINDQPETPFRYEEGAVNATDIPSSMNYPRIFINSFHHFSPPQVARIMKSSVDSGQSMLVLEYVRNTPLGYLSMVFGPIVILLTLPFVVRPKDLPVLLLFTYFIPVFPLMVLWDGLISCSRAYQERELDLIAQQNGIDGHFESYVKRSLFYPAGVTAIIFNPGGKKETSSE